MVAEITHAAPMRLCEAADTSPGVWGHKCIKSPHPRKEGHMCACGHNWVEAVEPTPDKAIRTVGGDLTL